MKKKVSIFILSLMLILIVSGCKKVQIVPGYAYTKLYSIDEQSSWYDSNLTLKEAVLTNEIIKEENSYISSEYVFLIFKFDVELIDYISWEGVYNYYNYSDKNTRDELTCYPNYPNLELMKKLNFNLSFRTNEKDKVVANIKGDFYQPFDINIEEYNFIIIEKAISSQFNIEINLGGYFIAYIDQVKFLDSYII